MSGTATARTRHAPLSISERVQSGSRFFGYFRRGALYFSCNSNIEGANIFDIYNFSVFINRRPANSHANSNLYRDKALADFPLKCMYGIFAQSGKGISYFPQRKPVRGRTRLAFSAVPADKKASLSVHNPQGSARKKANFSCVFKEPFIGVFDYPGNGLSHILRYNFDCVHFVPLRFGKLYAPEYKKCPEEKISSGHVLYFIRLPF